MPFTPAVVLSPNNVHGCVAVNMALAQQLLQSQRDVLLEWLSPNPSPLLRWLCDDKVLSRAQYLSLLERQPANAVAATLEVVCGSEASSLGFLTVLGKVQDYYCAQLQAWVQHNCPEEPLGRVSNEAAAPVKVEGKANSSYTIVVLLFQLL